MPGRSGAEREARSVAAGGPEPGPERGLEPGADPAPAPAGDPRLDGRDLPLDAHLHTDLSVDADVPIDTYARLAIERGIAELAITDHVDFDPAEPSFGVSFETRERIVRAAAERWADRVAIRFGAEITYASRWEPDIREHLARHRYDYVIGSVHVGPSSPYAPARVATSIAGHPLGEVVAPYFDEVVAAARSGLFDTLGHLDYVKRYVHPHIPPAAFAAAPELYDPALRALVEHGVALEINTSGLRQGPAEPYPPPWAVARFRELGGTAVTAGSDAHRAPAFAFALGAAYAAAAESGFGVLVVRRGSEIAQVRVPARFRT